jgi:hypothetical protein
MKIINKFRQKLIIKPVLDLGVDSTIVPQVYCTTSTQC